MNFKEWLKSSPLPPIPNEMVRLTHFTVENYAKEIVNTGFRYGSIQTTTDPHSTNEQVMETITAGAAGSMNRTHFGNYVILIDMPANYYKMLVGFNYEIKNDTIPPTQVLGYIDRKDMDLKKNPLYNPNKMTQPTKVNHHPAPDDELDDTKGIPQFNAPQEYNPDTMVF
jgi:hypothetical protein